MKHLTYSGQRSKMSSTAETLDIQEPKLPHTKKAPIRYDDGQVEGDFYNDAIISITLKPLT